MPSFPEINPPEHPEASVFIESTSLEIQATATKLKRTYKKKEILVPVVSVARKSKRLQKEAKPANPVSEPFPEPRKRRGRPPKIGPALSND